ELPSLPEDPAYRCMQQLGQPLDHVAGFMKLATLDRCVGAEGATDDFAQRLGAVDDEQTADLGIKPALDQIVHERLHDGGVLGCPSIKASGCLWPSASMPRAATSTRSLPMCSPSIWMTRRSSLDRSDVIHSASRSADSATNRREAADFEVPSPAMTGRSASGSRTARLSLRVDTLISIRFMAQRPSQSSACAALQVGSATSWPS